MKRVLASLVTSIVVMSSGIISAEAASADAPGHVVTSSPAAVPRSVTSLGEVRVSGTLLGVDGQPIVGLPVYIGDWDFEGCAYPDSTHLTQVDGSFSVIYERPTWSERNVLCFGEEYYGGPTWNAQDAQFVDLSQDLDIGVVQREPSASVKMRWLVDRDFISVVNEDSTTQAHAINLDTGSVYRGRFGGWEDDGVWETLELPLGEYRFAVRTLWWDPQTWVYYPGTMSPVEGEIVDVREDMTLPQEVQANPGIVKVGQSAWGTGRDWRIESCTTDWSEDHVHELWPDPEPDQWILPIGSYRLALYQGEELWDWTPCLQIAPHGVYETQWSQEARAIPPRSVTAFVTEDETNGQPSHRVAVEVVPGAVNTFLPTRSYRIDVIREGNGQSVANTTTTLDENFSAPFTAELETALPAGTYLVSVTSSVVVEGETLSSEPVSSARFEVAAPTPTPTGSPSPSPMPTPTGSRTPTPTSTASPSPTGSPTPPAEPTPSPSASPTASTPPTVVPSPSQDPSAPQRGPQGGAGGGSLAETGALAPPMALPIIAFMMVIAAGLLRVVSRRATTRAGHRRD